MGPKIPYQYDLVHCVYEAIGETNIANNNPGFFPGKISAAEQVNKYGYISTRAHRDLKPAILLCILATMMKKFNYL